MKFTAVNKTFFIVIFDIKLINLASSHRYSLSLESYKELKLDVNPYG